MALAFPLPTSNTLTAEEAHRIDKKYQEWSKQAQKDKKKQRLLDQHGDEDYIADPLLDPIEQDEGQQTPGSPGTPTGDIFTKKPTKPRSLLGRHDNSWLGEQDQNEGDTNAGSQIVGGSGGGTGGDTSSKPGLTPTRRRDKIFNSIKARFRRKRPSIRNAPQPLAEQIKHSIEQGRGRSNTTLDLGSGRRSSSTALEPFAVELPVVGQFEAEATTNILSGLPYLETVAPYHLNLEDWHTNYLHCRTGRSGFRNNVKNLLAYLESLAIHKEFTSAESETDSLRSHASYLNAWEGSRDFRIEADQLRIREMDDEQKDIALNKSSSQLLLDYRESLPSFLYADINTRQLHKRVSVRKTEKLVALLEPHQADPQLLDTHLREFIPELGYALEAAFKVEASVPPAPTTEGESKPVSWAICKLLYTFCKIRGDTVIIQFLNSETRLIEFLLSAFEKGNPSLEKLHSGDNVSAPDGDNSTVDPGISSPDVSTVSGPFWEWEWEQRYITLLWLSLLIRAPFDLRDISSRGTNGDIHVSGLEWPLDIPPVATRIVSLATYYLICAGKERDAAKILLVRMAVRKDMRAGFEALVDWVLASLQTTSNQATPSFYIGILSFLASALASCEGEFPRYQNVKLIYQDTTPEHLKLLQEIRNSDLGRKLEVKIRRNLCLKAFLNPHSDSFEDDVVDTINYLFDALLDRSTKVRLASSKALSICTLKMPPPMAEDVIDQIVNDLNADNYKVGGQLTRAFQLHGLTLTLSHLLYRQSPGCGKLSLIVSALLRSLAFEERSSSGQSIGTNVRDAACFGIWAIARKYKTEDLSEIQVDRAIDPVYGWEQHQGLSIIQILATELVVSACLDPERNIRRGASAALQELVGRHQNRVDRGLELSEAVNFQDVAWRSKAVLEVALTATKLSSLYGRALLHGFFGWRGVGDPDPAARRETAVAFGKIFWEMRYEHDRSSLVGPKISLDRYLKTTKQLRERLGQLAKREVEDRHGLQLCLSSVVGVLGHWLSEQDGPQEFHKFCLLPAFHHVIEVVYDLVVSTLEDAVNTDYRIPHLIAESTSRIIEASYPLLWAHALQVEKTNGEVRAGIDPTSFNSLFRSATSGLHVAPLSSDSTYSASNLTAPAISNDEIKLAEIEHDALVSQNSTFLFSAKLLISKWICLQENEVAKAASSAAERLFVFLSSHERQKFMDRWIEIISQRTDSNVRDRGVLSALLLVYPRFSSIEYQGLIIEAINKRWANYHRREKRNHEHFEARIIVLECLRNSCFSSSMVFSHIIIDGLDDYTIFERKGDVGMGVRLEAVKAVGTIWEGENHIALWSIDKGFNYFVVLVGRMLRLSCEKADKVRSEAQQALAHLEKYLGCEEFPPDSKMNEQTGKMEGPFAQLCTDLSSRKSLTKYFLYLLNIKPIGELSSKLGDQVKETIRDWRVQLIEGIVTSAGTGSGNLLPASRDALVQFCESDKEQAEHVCQTLIQILATNGGLSNKENDRLNMSTLEVIAFLFDVMIMQESGELEVLRLILKEARPNIASPRKLELMVRILGGMVQVHPRAWYSLLMYLQHRMPNIRMEAADALFTATYEKGGGLGKGIDWHKAGENEVKRIRLDLGLAVTI